MRALGIGAVWVLDRLTKIWAMRVLLPRGRIPVLPFFKLTYVENTGAAFGIGFSRNRFFIFLSSALLAGLYYLQREWPRSNRWLQAGLVLVAGGAIGNLYDRLAYGYVVDLLDFSYFFGFPVFNVADSCVTVGACCLAWGLRLEEKRERGAGSVSEGKPHQQQ